MTAVGRCLSLLFSCSSSLPQGTRHHQLYTFPLFSYSLRAFLRSRCEVASCLESLRRGWPDSTGPPLPQPVPTAPGLVGLKRVFLLHTHTHTLTQVPVVSSLPPPPLQNLQWARDVLLGSSVPWQQLKHMPAQGLFCERNKTNLFNVSRDGLTCYTSSSYRHHHLHYQHHHLSPHRRVSAFLSQLKTVWTAGLISLSS